MKIRNVAALAAMMAMSTPALAIGESSDGFSDFSMKKHKKIQDQHINDAIQDDQELSSEKKLVSDSGGEMSTAMYRMAEQKYDW